MSFKLALREFQLWFSGNLNNIRGFFRANLFCLIKKFLVNDKSVLVAFYLAGKPILFRNLTKLSHLPHPIALGFLD